MTSDRDPFSDPDASDAMLDELLAQARWPAPDAEAESRLRTRWMMARGKPRFAYRPLLAAAAVLAIVSGIWIAVHRQIERVPTVAVKPIVEPITPGQLPAAKAEPMVRNLGPVERLALIADKQRVAKKSAASSQPATPVDALASLRRLNNASLTRVAMQTRDADRRGEAIGLLLRRNQLQSFLYFVLKSDTRAQALAVLDAMPNPPIRALLAELDHQQVDYRLAAAKALGGLCDQGVGVTLMNMVEQNDHRREAIAALLSCSDPHAKQFLSRAQAYASADEIRSVQHDLNKTF